jgi:hypothetical protein
VRMMAAEKTFLERAKTIRDQHLLLQDYDRQMIAALTARRNEIEATSLMEMSVSDEIAGCSGKPLENLRWEAREEMSSLQSYLNEFQRALRSDPDGVFIDRPLIHYTGQGKRESWSGRRFHSRLETIILLDLQANANLNISPHA